MTTLWKVSVTVIVVVSGGAENTARLPSRTLSFCVNKREQEEGETAQKENLL